MRELKKLIEEELHHARDYDDFLRRDRSPTTSMGDNGDKSLHFFNKGYQSALVKILSIITAQEVQENTVTTLCPKCHQLRVENGMCWVVGCDYKVDNDPA